MERERAVSLRLPDAQRYGIGQLTALRLAAIDAGVPLGSPVILVEEHQESTRVNDSSTDAAFTPQPQGPESSQ